MQVSFFQPYGLSPFDPTKPPTGDRLVIAQLGVREPFGPGLCTRPQGIPGYSMLVLFHEACQIEVGGQLQRAPRNSFICWVPGQSQCYGTLGDEPFEHTYLILVGPELPTLIERTGIPTGVPIHSVNQEMFERGVGGLFDELIHPQCDAYLLGRLLEILLMRIGRCVHTGDSTTGDPRITEVYQTIATAFHQPWSLEELADRVSLSPSHLLARFRKQFGCTPLGLQTRLRVESAQQLLRDTNLQVRAVAQHVGYDDPYYFSRLFKARVGQSPRAYRNAPR